MQLSIRLSKAFDFILICLFVSFLTGCDSTNPLAPDEYEIDLNGEWVSTSMPESLLGNWFWNAMWDMAIGADTIEDSVKTTTILAVEKQGEIYRIIHKFKDNVIFSSYFHLLSKNEIRIAISDGAAADIAKARFLPLLEWYTVIRILPWENTTLPPEMPGNWHIPAGEEFSINETSITIAEKGWEIVAVQTNGTISRLLIKSGSIYKSFCYILDAGNYTMKVAIKDGSEIIHNKFGNLPESDWCTFSRWWDIRESFPLVQSTLWQYDFYYHNLYDPILDISGYWNVKKEDTKANGRFELELVASEINGVSGWYKFRSSFHIDKEEYYTNHTRFNPDNLLVEILLDTTIVEENFVLTNEYMIVEDNDSLWYETEEGRQLFAPVKMSYGTIAYLKMFTYPESNIYAYFLPLTINPSQTNTALAYYDDTEKECNFILGKGITNIHYLYTRHSESHSFRWSSQEEFTFELTEFIPGNL